MDFKVGDNVCIVLDVRQGTSFNCFYDGYKHDPNKTPKTFYHIRSVEGGVFIDDNENMCSHIFISGILEPKRKLKRINW